MKRLIRLGRPAPRRRSTYVPCPLRGRRALARRVAGRLA
jgi:hypothetical protein